MHEAARTATTNKIEDRTTIEVYINQIRQEGAQLMRFFFIPKLPHATPIFISHIFMNDEYLDKEVKRGGY